MKSYYLVDCENVQLGSIEWDKLIKEPSKDDEAILFLSRWTKKTTMEDYGLDRFGLKHEIIYAYAQKANDQSLDKALVTYLGVLIGGSRERKEKNKYYIVSNDKGYVNVIAMLNDLFPDEEIYVYRNTIYSWKEECSDEKNGKGLNDRILAAQTLTFKVEANASESANAKYDNAQYRQQLMKFMEKSGIPEKFHPQLISIFKKYEGDEKGLVKKCINAVGTKYESSITNILKDLK